MTRQQTLTGSWRLQVDVYETGTACGYLIHRPYTGSAFGAVLLAKPVLYLTDEEILDADWGSMLERLVQRCINQP